MIAEPSPNGLELYPVAYGHEHETSHLVKTSLQPDDPKGAVNYEAKMFVDNCLDYLPDDQTNVDQFTATGFRVYPCLSSFVEIASPECGDPKELVGRQKATRVLFAQMFENYLIKKSKKLDDIKVNGRTQDRVVDTNGTRKGSHLNLGLEDIKSSPLDISTVLAYQTTRPFVVGAGYVRERGYDYAQKVGGLSALSYYGFAGSMFRITEGEGTTRFEDRCGDINLSDWAAWQRAGGMAIALSVSRTPLAKELSLKASSNLEAYEYAKSFNPCHVTPDGHLKGDRYSYLAVDFQQQLAEIFMSRMTDYSDEIPPELYEVAQSLYEYCDAYRALLAGELTIQESSAQADWLVKLQCILNRVEKDKAQDVQRKFYDTKAQFIDQMYDARYYTALNGEIIERTEPIADKLYRGGQLEAMVTESDIQKALEHAPTSTRAKLREQLILHYIITSIDWHHATIADEKRERKISFPHVNQTEFDNENLEKISDVKAFC